jgi:hypothetical protein
MMKNSQNRFYNKVIDNLLIDTEFVSGRIKYGMTFNGFSVPFSSSLYEKSVFTDPSYLTFRTFGIYVEENYCVGNNELTYLFEEYCRRAIKKFRLI